MCLENEILREDNNDEIFGYVVCKKIWDKRSYKYNPIYFIDSDIPNGYIKNKKYQAVISKRAVINKLGKIQNYGFYGFKTRASARIYKKHIKSTYYGNFVIVKCKFKSIIAEGNQTLYYTGTHAYIDLPAFRAKYRIIKEEIR